MDENKNESIILLKNNTLKSFNSENKTFLNPEIISMKQDLLFFKNEILKDMRLLEEKINLKITDQNVINSEQFFEYEKKIETLTNKINNINTKVIDNSNLAEKINIFQSFQSKAEDQLNSVNFKIYSIQKEYKNYFNINEKTLDDNIRYPGLIGKNGRFHNFRKFIDYILSYFKEYNEFREEIRSFDINNLKKKIYSDLKDFRLAIDEGYRSTLNIILKSKRELESQLQDTLKQNKQMMEKNEQKLEELRNKIMKDLSDYQNNFADIKKNIDDKSNEQLNEIEILKNKLLNDMNNIKADFESIKKKDESKNENNELKYILKFIKNTYMPEGIHVLKEKMNYGNNTFINCNEINDKILVEEKKELNKPIRFINDNYQNYIIAKGRNNYFLKERLLNKNNYYKNNYSQEKNINIIDNYQICDEKNKTNKSSIFENNLNKIMNKTQINARFKSFKDNYDLLNINNYLYIDDNNDSTNKKERLSYTQDNIMNKKEGIDFFNSILKKTGDKYNFNKSENIEQKNIPRNNYSVSNIPEIKIKKMIFPDFLSKRNSKIEKKNSSSSNKNIQNLSNNKPSSARYMLKEGTNRKRKFFDLTKLVDYKNNKIKNKRFSESSKTIDKSMEHKIKDNLKSLLVINTK